MIDFFYKGGPLMYPILLCSVVGVAIIISKWIRYRQLIRFLERPPVEVVESPPEEFRRLFDAVRGGAGDQEISVIGTGLVREVEKGLSWLGVIAMISPLLGLTGTVLGMIRAFMVLSQNPVVDPLMLAGGIWEALITTAAGLLVAIPMHLGHHYLEKQADEIAFLLKEVAVFLKKERGADGV